MRPDGNAPEFVCTAPPPPCEDPRGTVAWQRALALGRRVNGRERRAGSGRARRTPAARPAARRPASPARRSRCTSRAGPDEPHESEPPLAAAARAPSPIHKAFPSAVDLLRAVNEYWGKDGFVRWERSPRTCSAACPSCKSKALRREHLSAGYPLVIAESEDGASYWFIPLCGCPEAAVVSALAEFVCWTDVERVA